MQRPKTYMIRDAAHQVLLQRGLLTLLEISRMTGIPKMKNFVMQ